MAAYYAALRLIERKRKRNFLAKKILKDLQNPFDLDEDAFKQKFCLNQAGVQYLSELIGPIMKRHQGYPVELQILSSLQVLRSGCYQTKIGEQQILQVSQATVSRNLEAFVDAIQEIVPRIIEFPSPTELAFTDPKFYGQSKIPNIIGLLDCIHVVISKPRVFGPQYLNSNYEYSINVMLVCNSDLYILDAVIMSPGSTPNSTIWYNSMLRNILQEYSMPNNSYLLGDSTFPLEPWLLVPYTDCQRSEELIFNDHVHRALTVIQECSAAIRKRFKCLHPVASPLHYAPEKCCKIITACFVLHNICLKLGLELDEPIDLNADSHHLPPTEMEFDDEEPMLTNEAMRIRDEVAKLLIS